MKQTAVEWLIDALMMNDEAQNYNQWAFNKAKEMEKQEAVDFAYEIADDLACGVLSKKDIEDRYNETFKSE
jgi:hypothetical protein